ncbi:TetR/AcrR family transcriptional regulator [Salibacter halophilus]|uniref:TetR/AcrR family transcriptional regulator n=1 Tax=Salibacter halophilus TaxID=1803916 RepID=A0A6N6M1M3_9FLAO|nr:TetR/AcrR family transcriptional regulator [Salibacter halophilus]KAB1062122.1 TetR/AcrR family transcriptional regulator [Salibacter halophilus]
MIQIKLNEKIYIKDPETSELGRMIVSDSITLIDKWGLENFTFRKLSKEINSTEASIYRYFENKYQLLAYLNSWYWNWMEYRVNFSINNIVDPYAKLEIIIELLTQPIERDPNFTHIDEKALHRIIISESAKTYLRKNVDETNKEGYFKSYKSLTKQLANIIREITPEYKYAESLISLIIEGGHSQVYFADHLPSLTNVNEKNCSLVEFCKDIVFSVIKKNK